MAFVIFFTLEKQEIFRDYVSAALFFSLKHPVVECGILCEAAFTGDYYNRQMGFHYLLQWTTHLQEQQ